MPEKLYTYAVARIRSQELLLLDAQFIGQLLAAGNYEECVQLLRDKGWGKEGRLEPEQVLADEREKAWALMAELVEDMSVFDVFLFSNDYHNLKTAIKLIFTGATDEKLFISHGTVDHKMILQAIETQEYFLLPEAMREPAKEAYEALLHTQDGQLCDRIIDKAALDAIYQAGKNQNNDLLRQYAELTVATADIKIAVRAQKTGKPYEWIRKALADCDTLNADKLALAAESGFDEICEYLMQTDYADAVKELRDSLPAFERWIDNHLIRMIRPQKYNSFTVSPLAAYLLARENEIKTVRIILLGKLNQLAEESIRERLRDMYV
jgi:V/A-type H+-transporting ATPase subunit C